MSTQNLKAIRSQAGFTLVELAIVMIIIGLLIGGVLKGQELIGNAQVTATVAQLKGIEAATSTFRDTYSALPGDITTPGTRLPNCTATGNCDTAGNGDGRLGNTPTATPVGAEGGRFFVHLNAAGLLTGIVPGTNTPGGNFPEAKVRGNVISVGSAGLPADLGAAVDSTGASAGMYLTIVNAVGAATTGTTGLKPSEALRIDTKLDDGIPGTGSVRAIGTATCGGTGAAGTYLTSGSGATCGLYVRTQS